MSFPRALFRLRRRDWQDAGLKVEAGIDWALDPEAPAEPAVDATVGPCHGCGSGTYRTVTLWPEDRIVFECASCRP